MGLLKHHHWTGLFSIVALLLGIAVITPPALAAGIADTKHNLGSTGKGPNHTLDTTEICVFCHTPHGFDSTGAPLWNKLLPTSTIYTTYASLNSSTMDGIVGKPGAVSLACLSCHDGAQAMDNMINAPGSGGFDPTGGGAAGRGFTWVGDHQIGGKLINAGGSAAMLSTDLSNDHPIGLDYCGGPKAGVIGTCKDPDFALPNAPSGQMATGPWWVDTADGTGGVRQKTDIILYAANSNRTTGIGPQVECGSCHDPHSSNGIFLRRQAGNTNSTTCLSCHTK